MRCPSHPFAPPLSPSGNPSRRHAGRVVFAPALSSLLQVRFPAPFQLVAKFVHAVLHFDDQVGYLRLGHELWCRCACRDTQKARSAVKGLLRRFPRTHQRLLKIVLGIRAFYINGRMRADGGSMCFLKTAPDPLAEWKGMWTVLHRTRRATASRASSCGSGKPSL